jgi:hypothetical protein
VATATEHMEVEFFTDGEMDSKQEGEKGMYASDDMKPMKVRTDENNSDSSDSGGGSWLNNFCGGNNKDDVDLAPFQKLFSDHKILESSMNVLRFAVFADAINNTM